MDQEQEEQGFWEAIRQDPKDNTPRLVYANWLDQHDQADRAEFIRTQIARPADRVPDAASRRELESRTAELLREHQEWKQPLADLGATHIVFRRGFPEHVAMPADRFLKNADRLFAIAPVTSVQLTGRMDPEAVQGLADSPYLANLTDLNLGYTAIGPAGARVLAHSPHLAKLTSLALWNNDIGPAGARALATSPHLAKLTDLDLGSNNLGDAGAQALATSPHLANLTYLTLGYNDIGDAGAQALATSPHLAMLTDLNLGFNPIGDTVLREIERTLQSRRNGQGQRGGRGA